MTRSDRAFRGSQRGCWFAGALRRFQFEVDRCACTLPPRAIVRDSTQRYRCTKDAYHQDSSLFRQTSALVRNKCSSGTMLTLPQPFCTVQCHDLDPNSTEYAFDVTAWLDHPTNGKKYGCIGEAGRDRFKQSERLQQEAC
jgi:hypothetical protein